MKKKNFVIFSIILVFSFIFINDVNALSFARVTNDDGVSLRTGPGTNYTKDGTLKYNDVVPLFSVVKETGSGCSDGWYKIDYNGENRYVCSKYLSTSTYTVKINYSSGVNSRDGFGTNYPIYKKLENDKLMTLSTVKNYEGVGCSKGWYSLNYNTYKDKYVCSNYTDGYNSISNIIVTNSTGVNLRKNASTASTKTGNLKYGQALTLDDAKKYTGTGCSAGWYKVHYNGDISYVCSTYVANKNKTGVINYLTTDVNVREKASSVSSKIASLPYNSTVVLDSTTKHSGSGCTSGWYKISLNGKDGYVCSSYVSTTNYRTYVSSATVNVRSDASASGSKITSLNKNDIVILQNTTKTTGDGCSSGWYKISLNGKDSYVCSSYTKLGKDTASSSSTTVTTTSKVITKRNTEDSYYYTINKWTYRVNEDYAYVRTSATSSSTIKDTVYLGTELDYISTVSAGNGCSDGWYKVSYYGGKTGYICKTYVDKYSSVTKTDTTYCNKLKKSGFPESYCPYLSYLHSKYPNWIFKAEKTGYSFLKTINEESGKNYTQINKSPYLVSSYIAESPNWRVASDAYVAFMLDPRNYFNEKNIFVFEDLNYDAENHTKDIVRTIFDGTYLDDDTYAGYFVNAGKTYDVSPVHLAARAKQEGSSNSSYDAISGKVSTKWNSETGYVCSSYTKFPSKKSVSPTDGGVNIRTGAGTNYKVTAISNNTSEKYILESNTKYTGKGCSKGWYKLNFNGEECYICSSYVKVNSSTSNKGYISTSGKLNIREGYGTGYDIVTTAKNKNTFTLLSSKKYTGSGCSAGWYKIKLDGYSLANIYNYYNIGSYGDNPVLRGLATAAGYVDSETGTPWNTREKAIKYGARWIANGYINEGQNTLYYQKFNTSPNATTDPFTHQYQTNILAPASEGLSFYRTYKDVKALSKSLVFNIPVYNSMPSNATTHPPIS